VTLPADTVYDMTATPEAYAASRQPPTDSGHPWYNEQNLWSVSWQLGF
jgi:hypothetical protein